MNAEDNNARGQASNNREPRAYAKIPNNVVHDCRLSYKALALLSYRLTKTGDFSLSEDAAAIGLPLSDKSKGRKIGRSQFL